MMKKNRAVYIVVLMLVCGNCCLAQKKLASDKPIQSFYSQRTKAYLDKKQPVPGAAAMARPVLASQKSMQDLQAVSGKHSMLTATHPNNNLTPVQKQKQLPSYTVTMAQFSKQSLTKRNKSASQF